MLSQEFPLAPYTVGMFYIVAAVIAVVMAGLLGLMLYVAIGFNRVSLEISGDKLQVHGIFYGRTLDKKQLKVNEARVVDVTGSDRDYEPVRRNNGLGTSQFKYGMFTLHNGEKALVALSDPHRAVYLPTTEGYNILASPKDPEAFLAALRK